MKVDRSNAKLILALLDRFSLDGECDAPVRFAVQRLDQTGEALPGPARHYVERLWEAVVFWRLRQGMGAVLFLVSALCMVTGIQALLTAGPLGPRGILSLAFAVAGVYGYRMTTTVFWNRKKVGLR